jgi:hypothetical protein
MKITSIFLTTAAMALLFSACDKHDHTENENITRVELKLTGAGISQTFTARETNGDDIWDSIDEVVLPASTTPILCEVFVYDDTQSPSVNLTTEIIEESADHVFTYTVTGANLTIVSLDADKNGKPFRQNTSWSTGAASTGSLQVKLYHEPKNKDSANPGGEVDLDITFPVKIQ